MAFSLPVQKASVHGWGPSSNENLNKFTLYASYNKSDRLGKVADFTTHFHHSRLRHNTTNSVNGEFQYKHDTQDDASFELVDTVKVSKPKYAERLRPFASRVGRTNTRNNNNQGKAGNSPSGKNPHVRMKGQQQLNKRWDRLNNARRMYSTRKREEHRVDRPASVLVESSWEIVEQFELSQLTKLQMNRPEVEDLKWCGELSGFDDAYDRVNTKNEKKLRDFSQVTFRNESTSDDPVLEEFAKSDVGNVYATDAILALLMASTRSVNPWDIVVSSVGGKLFFDKRDGKYFDHEAVNETAFEGPVTEDVLDLNHPDNLAVEATLVKRYFSEQIVKEVVRKLENENPFKDGDQTAKVGYRYRKWTIGEDVQLVARCSLNGIAMKGGEEEFMAAFALNEWDSKLAKGIEWRSKIDSQVWFLYYILLYTWCVYISK